MMLCESKINHPSTYVCPGNAPMCHLKFKSSENIVSMQSGKAIAETSAR